MDLHFAENKRIPAVVGDTVHLDAAFCHQIEERFGVDGADRESAFVLLFCSERCLQQRGPATSQCHLREGLDERHCDVQAGTKLDVEQGVLQVQESERDREARPHSRAHGAGQHLLEESPARQDLAQPGEDLPLPNGPRDVVRGECADEDRRYECNVKHDRAPPLKKQI